MGIVKGFAACANTHHTLLHRALTFDHRPRRWCWCFTIGGCHRCAVEYAPLQKVPALERKKHPLEGTIDKGQYPELRPRDLVCCACPPPTIVQVGLTLSDRGRGRDMDYGVPVTSPSSPLNPISDADESPLLPAALQTPTTCSSWSCWRWASCRRPALRCRPRAQPRSCPRRRQRRRPAAAAQWWCRGLWWARGMVSGTACRPLCY